MQVFFDVSIDPEEYRYRTKIRTQDSSMLGQKIQMQHHNQPIQLILDIGCGSGYSTLELSTRFHTARVVGIDSNPTLIEHAPNITKNVEFYCFDIGGGDPTVLQRLCSMTDIHEGSVDIIVSTYWLTSLPSKSLNRALANIERLLRPDSGTLYLLDCVWTGLMPIIYNLNETPKWKCIVDEYKKKISMINGISDAVEPSTEAAIAPLAACTQALNQETEFLPPLPTSNRPPTQEQINNRWLRQFRPFTSRSRETTMEVCRLVLNFRRYEFESMNDMINMMETFCPTLQYFSMLNDHHQQQQQEEQQAQSQEKEQQQDGDEQQQAISTEPPPPPAPSTANCINYHHQKYFVDFIRDTFDQCFFPRRQLSIPYYSLLIVARRKKNANYHQRHQHQHHNHQHHQPQQQNLKKTS